VSPKVYGSRAGGGTPAQRGVPPRADYPARARARFAHGSAVLVVARVGWLGPHTTGARKLVA
jgi:hypothetical protein